MFPVLVSQNWKISKHGQILGQVFRTSLNATTENISLDISTVTSDHSKVLKIPDDVFMIFALRNYSVLKKVVP